jgi:hypothetical protein
MGTRADRQRIHRRSTLIAREEVVQTFSDRASSFADAAMIRSRTEPSKFVTTARPFHRVASTFGGQKRRVKNHSAHLSSSVQPPIEVVRVACGEKIAARVKTD